MPERYVLIVHFVINRDMYKCWAAIQVIQIKLYVLLFPSIYRSCHLLLEL